VSWAAVAVGAVSVGIGVYQTVKADQERKKAQRDKPEYEIPEEVGMNQSLAEQVAYEGLPAASRTAFNKEVQRSQASMLSRTGELQAGISGMAAAQVANQDALSQLYSRDAEARIRGKQAQMGANLDMARARDQVFNIDFADYQQQLASAQAMAGAGMQNIYGGVSSVAGGLSTMDFGKNNTEKPPREKKQKLTTEQQVDADIAAGMYDGLPEMYSYPPPYNPPPNIVTSQNYGPGYVQ